MTNVIETRNLSKVYVRDVIGSEHGRLKINLFNRNVHALKNLTMDVKEGEIFGLLGPNGAGKTTTIKILMTLHEQTSGTARIFGKPLGNREAKARIGFLPENPYFYDYLLGWEFLDYYGQLYGMSRRKRRRRAEELLERVGIPHAANLPLRGYSKGMLQRIGLAQALLNDPQLVILDEPQSGLDPLGRKEVRDIILSLREEGKTVCFSSHILSDAELVCDRVAIVYKGELVALGTLNELLSARVKETDVEVSGLGEHRVQHYRQLSKRFLQQGNEVLFVVEKSDLADEIVRETVQAGGRVVAVTPRKETLEEYFIGKVSGDTRRKPTATAPPTRTVTGAPRPSGGTRPVAAVRPAASSGEGTAMMPSIGAGSNPATTSSRDLQASAALGPPLEGLPPDLDAPSSTTDDED